MSTIAKRNVTVCSPLKFDWLDVVPTPFNLPGKTRVESYQLLILWKLQYEVNMEEIQTAT